MRKLIVLSSITVDGVMQAPGGPEEDTSGGFTYGGWQAPYLDEFLGKVLDEQWREPFDLLLCKSFYSMGGISIIKWAVQRVIKSEKFLSVTIRQLFPLCWPFLASR